MYSEHAAKFKPGEPFGKSRGSRSDGGVGGYVITGNHVIVVWLRSIGNHVIVVWLRSIGNHVIVVWLRGCVV